jgi:hypothetical protein
MCGWIPLMTIVRDPDAVVELGEDGRFKMTFEAVYFNGIHLKRMNTDQLEKTLGFMKETRKISVVGFTPDVWMPINLHEIDKFSEAYHSFLNKTLEEKEKKFRVRFGFEGGKPFARFTLHVA